MNVKNPTEQVKSVIEPRTLVTPHLEIKLDIQVNYKMFLVVLLLKGIMRFNYRCRKFSDDLISHNVNKTKRVKNTSLN